MRCTLWPASWPEEEEISDPRPVVPPTAPQLPILKRPCSSLVAGLILLISDLTEQSARNWPAALAISALMRLLTTNVCTRSGLVTTYSSQVMVQSSKDTSFRCLLLFNKVSESFAPTTRAFFAARAVPSPVRQAGFIFNLSAGVGGYRIETPERQIPMPLYAVKDGRQKGTFHYWSQAQAIQAIRIFALAARRRPRSSYLRTERKFDALGKSTAESA